MYNGKVTPKNGESQLDYGYGLIRDGFHRGKVETLDSLISLEVIINDLTYNYE